MNRMTRNGLKAVLVAGVLMAAGAGPRAQDSVFGDFVWHHIDAYCTFMRADNFFKFDDPDSWRFVASANYPNENGAEPLDRLFIRINADFREFSLVEARESDGVQRRIYRTAGNPLIEVEMQISGSKKAMKRQPMKAF